MNKFAVIPLIMLLCSCEHLNRLTNRPQGNDYLAGVGHSTQGITTDVPPEARLGQGFWDVPAGLTGPKKIIIDTKQQQVTYYIGDTLVGKSPMSSGKEGFGTPPGTYKIIQKEKNYKSGTYGVLRSRATNEIVDNDFNTKGGKPIPAGAYYDAAPMPYFMRFYGGYGMHVGFVAGYPVSHGCVRLPEDMAKVFFENTPLNTTCIVK